MRKRYKYFKIEKMHKYDLEDYQEEYYYKNNYTEGCVKKGYICERKYNSNIEYVFILKIFNEFIIHSVNIEDIEEVELEELLKILKDLIKEDIKENTKNFITNFNKLEIINYG